ncbi:MAG: SpoIID/LytB domain-containing protein, partial [Huintestinicola sp.]
MPELPIVPEFITVHLGKPSAAARNVRVPFSQYIKNVASSEIYPTWPESSLRANIYAEITFALNRIYTEHYRSRGYDFDITNSTQFDQYYVEGRDIFENISRVVDDIFNDYVVKQGQIQPYFTQYCAQNCEGLSQWGTVTLANQGYTPYRI